MRKKQKVKIFTILFCPGAACGIPVLNGDDKRDVWEMTPQWPRPSGRVAFSFNRPKLYFRIVELQSQVGTRPMG